VQQSIPNQRSYQTNNQSQISDRTTNNQCKIIDRYQISDRTKPTINPKSTIDAKSSIATKPAHRSENGKYNERKDGEATSMPLEKDQNNVQI